MAAVPTGRSAGPFDPRLLHYARATRAYLILSVAVGGVAAFGMIAQAWLIATIVNGAFIDHRGVSSLRAPLIGLLAVVAGLSRPAQGQVKLDGEIWTARPANENRAA